MLRFQCVLRFSAPSRHVTHLVDIGKRSTLDLLEHSRWDVSPATKLQEILIRFRQNASRQSRHGRHGVGPGDVELS